MCLCPIRRNGEESQKSVFCARVCRIARRDENTTVHRRCHGSHAMDASTVPPSKRCRKNMPALLRRLATLLQATHACLTARAPHSRPATKSRHAAPSSATLSFNARMAHTPTHHAKASAALHTGTHTHTGTRATARPLTTPAHYQRKLRHRSRARVQKHANTVPKKMCQQRANNVPLRPAAWGITPGGGKAPRFSPVRSRPALLGKDAARPATYTSQLRSGERWVESKGP